MGAGASFDAAGPVVASSTPFFCHACSESFLLTESTRRSELSCPRCHSLCLEEFSDDRRWMLNGSFMPRARPFHGMSFSENLTYEQSRRLLNASIMLRLLEAQLREELESLQLAYSASLAQETAAAKSKGLSDVMKEKLRRPLANVDMICSQPCCPICSDDFIVDAECLQMPCSHIFHENCVFPWLEGKKTCPICRYELNDNCLTVEELQKFSKPELLSMLAKHGTPELDVSNGDRLVGDLAVDVHRLLAEKAAAVQVGLEHENGNGMEARFAYPMPMSRDILQFGDATDSNENEEDGETINNNPRWMFGGTSLGRENYDRARASSLLAAIAGIESDNDETV